MKPKFYGPPPRPSDSTSLFCEQTGISLGYLVPKTRNIIKHAQVFWITSPNGYESGPFFIGDNSAYEPPETMYIDECITTKGTDKNVHQIKLKNRK